MVCVQFLLVTLCALMAACLAPSAQAGSFSLAGVNEAGLEFAPQTLPGTAGTTYTAPAQSSIDYFKQAGASVIRLPFNWERLQQTPSASLNAEYLALIDTAVEQTTASGSASIILDCHNYARYTYQGSNQVITQSAVLSDSFVDLWTRLATKYASNPKVVFGLMNEPYGVDTKAWFALAQRTMTAIRGAGANNLILLCGNAWSGAHSWLKTTYGVSNGDSASTITDSNFAFEMHQYFDSDASGTNEACPSTSSNYLADVQKTTAWLKNKGYKAFMGEFATGTSSACLQLLDSFLGHLAANSDVWMGFSYWAAGPWWGTTFYNIEPANDAISAPQWSVVSKYIKGGSADTDATQSLIFATTSVTTALVTYPTASSAADEDASTVTSVTSSGYMVPDPVTTIEILPDTTTLQTGYSIPTTAEVDGDVTQAVDDCQETSAEPTPIVVIPTPQISVGGDVTSVAETVVPVITTYAEVDGDATQAVDDCQETSAEPTPIVVISTPQISVGGDAEDAVDNCDTLLTPAPVLIQIATSTVATITVGGDSVDGDTLPTSSATEEPIYIATAPSDPDNIENFSEASPTEQPVIVPDTTAATGGYEVPVMTPYIPLATNVVKQCRWVCDEL